MLLDMCHVETDQATYLSEKWPKSESDGFIVAATSVEALCKFLLSD